MDKTEAKNKENVQAENEDKKQPKISKDTLIKEKSDKLAEQYGAAFEADAYKSAAAAYLENHDDLEGFDGDGFVNKKENNNDNDKDKDKDKNDKEKQPSNETEGNGKCYHGGYENGKYVFRGPKGERIEGKDYAEAKDKICVLFAKEAKEEGREGTIYTRWHNVPEAEEKEQRDISSRTAIKHGLTILGGWSKEPQFWQDLKKDYLADKNHKLEDWERMTRKIPDEVMQRTPEEKARNKKLNDADIIAQMRKGKNPNLQEPTVPAAQSPKEQAPNGKEPVSPTISITDKEQKTGDAALIDQMRHGVNPNVPETMPKPKAATQQADGQKPLTQEEILAAIRRNQHQGQKN